MEAFRPSLSAFSRGSAALLLLLALAACQRPLPPTDQLLPSDPGTGSLLEGVTSPDSAPASSSSSSSETALTERITDRGLLELSADASAPALIFFTNESCEYCKTFSREITPRLIHDYVQSGKLRYQVAILPLDKYPGSRLDASAIICAAEQGKGFAMHESLYSVRNHVPESMTLRAKSLRLDSPVFEECLAAPQTTALVSAGERLAQGSGVTLVPTLILNGEKFVGLPKFGDLRGWIESLLH